MFYEPFPTPARTFFFVWTEIWDSLRPELEKETLDQLPVGETNNKKTPSVNGSIGAHRTRVVGKISGSTSKKRRGLSNFKYFTGYSLNQPVMYLIQIFMRTSSLGALY